MYIYIYIHTHTHTYTYIYILRERERERDACVCAKWLQSCPTLCYPRTVACQAPLSIEFSRQEYWSGLPFLSPEDLTNPEIRPRSPALQVDSLPSEPPGKPEDTGVGSLCLLQGIFQTQESNWCLLHCRRILYQLSYQGSPGILISSRLLTNSSLSFVCL